MGRCKVLCALCFWAPELVADWLDFGLAGTVFAPPGWILCPPGRHFESFVSLWGEPEVPGARHCEKFEKVQTNEATWELNWEPFGTHFETAASQNRADKRFVALLCQFCFERISRSVPKRVFRGNC